MLSVTSLSQTVSGFSLPSPLNESFTRQSNNPVKLPCSTAGLGKRFAPTLSTALVAAALLLTASLQGADFHDVKGEPGLSYLNDRIKAGPLSVHILRVDRSRKDLSLYSAHAKDKVLGVSMLADQARAVPAKFGRALAAVNGDFYVRDTPGFAGDPRGLQIINGELISGPDTACVWIDAEENPHLDHAKGEFSVIWPDDKKTAIGLNQQRTSGRAVLYTPTYGPSTRTSGGRDIVLERDGDSPWLPLQVNQTYRARVREIRTNGNTRLVPDAMVLSMTPQLLASRPELAPGSVLKISTGTAPELKGVRAAIGGGPALIENGTSSFTAKSAPPGASDWTQRSKYERHPRAAVGWSATHIYLLVVDGRQSGSVGIKLADLADYMLRLGCTEAMNLDGGKSAQMWLSGEIVNEPCQGEDTVANSLIVVRRPKNP